MYTLYYLPGACALATQVILRELKQPFELVDKRGVDNFLAINPTGKIPVLNDGENCLVEGAAILLYLLNKHENNLLPQANVLQKQQAMENILFANATMHPAYNRLFFATGAIADEHARQPFLEAAAVAINELWVLVEKKLAQQSFLGGDQVSTADIMLAVYARWGTYFPVDIIIPEKVSKMLAAVEARPSFIASIAAEQAHSTDA
ncbi:MULTISPECIES: glutathione S-transferase family protein [unclassified Pseudoalteromonas]|uniref:glutathione S-transferase family protein n=1 Tax=unclassified Pseudoalteromonas TaxID=194690 RepID=UPI001F2683E0|nr:MULTISPECIES: glutathione S-transferase family protein [unclassified Pseudoalteromonas]MCF2827270.1 glutathione S-transferase family protein [Pseudoalteromonas sp. OF5H-5]MCF2831505.1 glutathione S-transferase family protein [Pseudoalteromonas sp. DL2-H6]MCF2926428.1 glutathione S-transferase family protein [Pseudoalteromonas sp. DL2-H1]